MWINAGRFLYGLNDYVRNTRIDLWNLYKTSVILTSGNWNLKPESHETAASLGILHVVKIKKPKSWLKSWAWLEGET